MFGWFKKKARSVEDVQSAEPVREDFSRVEPLINYFKTETGIDFDAKKEVITPKLARFCRDRNCNDFESCLGAVRRNVAIRQELIDYLTVNETYFCREMAQIQEAVDFAVMLGRRISILCAPSSTGEEPYTIAMLLLQAGVDSSHFSITGIDINADAVRRSREACYRERSLHRMPEGMADAFFTRTETGYCLVEQVKRCVEFRCMNIFDPAFDSLGRFDVIFSRNMLIYFDTETRIRAKRRLEGLLRDDRSRIFFGHADLGGIG